MKPGERIELIKRCARVLGQDAWDDIDFVLGQFTLPTSNEWDDQSDQAKYNYCREMLGSRHNSDDTLAALDEYLGGRGPETDSIDGTWAVGSLRVFITHVAAHKDMATELSGALGRLGVDAFVAHEDIDPGAEWVTVVIAALRTCHALVGLLHDGWRKSNWCDQEVGCAFGRGIPVVPVRCDHDPYGFFGTVQAVTKGTKVAEVIAEEIVAILAKDKRTVETMIESLVVALENVHSFDMANTVARLLNDHAAGLDRDQVDRLRKAQNENSQVSSAWHVDLQLNGIERKLGIDRKLSQAVLPSADEEEPF